MKIRSSCGEEKEIDLNGLNTTLQFNCAFANNSYIPTNSSSGGGSGSGYINTSSDNSSSGGGSNGSSSLVCQSSCSSDNKCYPIGYRKDGQFCSDTLNFLDQLPENNICENNFECNTNVCVNNKCISKNFIEKFIEWLSRLFSN